jgi:hypothetical protein
MNITTERQVFKHKIYLVANANGGMRCNSQGSAFAFVNLVDAQANAGTDGGVYVIHIDSPLACPQAAMLDPSFGDEVEAGATGLGLMNPQVMQRETAAIKSAQAKRERIASSAPRASSAFIKQRIASISKARAAYFAICGEASPTAVTMNGAEYLAIIEAARAAA